MKKTALISVFYKDKLEEFAKELKKMDWDIISTGGTLNFLKEKSIPATDVTEITGFPEILDGRVKTLSPNVFAGLLYKRDDEEHVNTVNDFGIRSIDMVVNILYPFEETVANPNSTKEEIIEKIDIGGPSMIRAASKNFKDVVIVTSTDQYDKVIKELKKDELGSLEFRKEMAKEAFIRTASYDISIANYFQDETEDDGKDLLMHYERERKLRYGENPHQDAELYVNKSNPLEKNSDKILQGKELSYNNMLDITAAKNFIRNFKDDPTVIGIKHTNPCAIASHENIETAYENCILGDSESIFGGIIILNRPVTAALAEKMTSFFLEIVIAPKIEEAAIEIFKKKANLRVIEASDLMKDRASDKEYRFVSDGILVQDVDNKLYNEIKIVTKTSPSEKEMEDLKFAYKCVKCIKSNGIAIVKDKRTLGLGIGDVNRFFASSHALDMAGDEARGAVVASDGFFPFADSIAAFAEKGITSVIQPGGSIKDKDSIEYADKVGISMVFTGMRHFRH